MRPITAPKARLRAIGPILVLTGGLYWGHCQALEHGGALSVKMMLNTQNSCTTSLLDYSFGLALSTCEASSFQASAIHLSWRQTTAYGTTRVQVLETGLMTGLLGSRLKHWPLVKAEWPLKSNKLSQENSYYELRVDY